MPELSATPLAQSSPYLASIPAGSVGLRVGSDLFLASSTRLELADSRQPADVGFGAGGALYLVIRSGLGITRTLASRLFYPI